MYICFERDKYHYQADLFLVSNELNQLIKNLSEIEMIILWYFIFASQKPFSKRLMNSKTQTDKCISKFCAHLIVCLYYYYYHKFVSETVRLRGLSMYALTG